MSFLFWFFCFAIYWWASTSWSKNTPTKTFPRPHGASGQCGGGWGGRGEIGGGGEVGGERWREGRRGNGGGCGGEEVEIRMVVMRKGKRKEWRWWGWWGGGKGEVEMEVVNSGGCGCCFHFSEIWKRGERNGGGEWKMIRVSIEGKKGQRSGK